MSQIIQIVSQYLLSILGARTLKEPLSLPLPELVSLNLLKKEISHQSQRMCSCEKVPGGLCDLCQVHLLLQFSLRFRSKFLTNRTSMSDRFKPPSGCDFLSNFSTLSSKIRSFTSPFASLLSAPSASIGQLQLKSVKLPL